MKIHRTLMTMTIFALATVLAAPWGRADVITDRQKNQEDKIMQAAKDGKISALQEKSLTEKQQKIEKIRVKAMKDGKLSPREEKKLQKRLDALDKKIDKDIHKKKSRKKQNTKKTTNVPK